MRAPPRREQQILTITDMPDWLGQAMSFPDAVVDESRPGRSRPTIPACSRSRAR
jgi:hypothetical protein